MMMLIRLHGGGERLSSGRSSGRSLFGDIISMQFLFLTSRSMRIGSLLGGVLRRSSLRLSSVLVLSPSGGLISPL